MRSRRGRVEGERETWELVIVAEVAGAYDIAQIVAFCIVITTIAVRGLTNSPEKKCQIAEIKICRKNHLGFRVTIPFVLFVASGADSGKCVTKRADVRSRRRHFSKMENSARDCGKIRKVLAKRIETVSPELEGGRASLHNCPS